MCGIAGILNEANRSVDEHQLGRMLSTLVHRGPDACGLQVDGPMGLAHTRLSIIDLSGGAQPMATQDRRLWITFNGEIFNYVELREELMRRGHRFVTRSDTEVILEAYREYGEQCVEHFNGQWAFAIWDTVERKLFLSRDRFGVRPLFYTQTKDAFLFASEVKALFACPEVARELDLVGLDQIFTFWVTLAPRTVFKNICQLPPAHSLTLRDGRIHVHRYWNLDYMPDENGVPNERRGAEELLALLLDAATIRLRSDVPLGAYLSGGLDSAVITALITRVARERLRTFSVTFEDAEFDESRYQREAAEFFHTEHREVRCTGDDTARLFPQVIWHAEQPILRTAPAPLMRLSQQVRAAGFKVVLTGEGADEIFGGYDIFKETKVRQFWGRRPDSHWRALLLKRLYPYMDNLQRQSPAYLKCFFHVTEEDLASPFFSHLPRWELTAKLKNFFSAAVRQEGQPQNAIADLESALPASFFTWPAFTRAEYLEAAYLLPGYILSSQGDRMAMANSVEGRYPFLDHRLVAFAARLPVTLKMKVLDQKHILKLAFAGRIPACIQKRAKQPYRAPDGKSFMQMGAPEYVDDLLSPVRIASDGVFDPIAVAALVAKFRHGRAIGVKDNMALVGILSTQLLLEQFIRSHDRRDAQCGAITQAKYAALS